MDNTNFIKAVKDIINNVTWNAMLDDAANSQQTDDILKSLEILNSKKVGYNTLSLLIDVNYHDILFEITDNLTEDELSEQGFNSEFALKLAPYVAKHILKRYLKVSGKDARCESKTAIVLNFDISKVTYFITPRHEEEQQQQ